MKKEEWIIIGGGAAGASAAITLARAGKSVTLLEQNSRIGKKISVSGNGKCNVGNRNIDSSHFHSQNRNFVDKILNGCGADKVIKFFHSTGLHIVEKDDGKLFPLSMQANSVIDLLEYAIQEADAKIITECKVTNIEYKDGSFVLQTSLGEKSSTHLMIASGSVAAPALGGSDSGYLFATKMGHTLIPRRPVLVPLCSDESWIKRCSGVKIKGSAKLYANGEYITERNGDLLFTDYGISGLAILDISAEVSARLANYDYCELSLDLMPDYSKEALTNLLSNMINKKSDKSLSLWLEGIIHKKLIPIIIEHAKTKANSEASLDRKEINRLVHTIKNLRLHISDTRGFKYAEAVAGGVNAAEIDPHSLESKLIPNLYFGGEVIDVNGDRGGFNFHFAWVCGMRVGGV